LLGRALEITDSSMLQPVIGCDIVYAAENLRDQNGESYYLQTFVPCDFAVAVKASSSRTFAISGRLATEYTTKTYVQSGSNAKRAVLFKVVIDHAWVR
jgi:hypothetical protein